MADFDLSKTPRHRLWCDLVFGRYRWAPTWRNPFRFAFVPTGDRCTCGGGPVTPDREALAAAVREGLRCTRQDDFAEDTGAEFSVCDEHDEDWPCGVAERVVDALLSGPLAAPGGGADG